MVQTKKICMMTSSNGNIFRVTGPLCGEFTGPGEFPAQRPVTLSFDVFFDLRLINDWVNNREAGDLRRYRGHYDVIVMRLWSSLIHISDIYILIPVSWLHTFQHLNHWCLVPSDDLVIVGSSQCCLSGLTSSHVYPKQLLISSWCLWWLYIHFKPIAD